MKAINKIKAYYRLLRLRKVFTLEYRELYNNIDDLPVWNYYEVINTGNLKYLAKAHDYSKPFRYNKKKAFHIWEALNDQFIDTFGVSKEHEDILLLEMELAIYEYEWKVEKIPSARSYYNVLKKELDNLKLDKPVEKGILLKQIFYIEKEMKFKIDEKTLSVKNFMLYINQLSEIAKQIKNGKGSKGE